MAPEISDGMGVMPRPPRCACLHIPALISSTAAQTGSLLALDGCADTRLGARDGARAPGSRGTCLLVACYQRFEGLLASVVTPLRGTPGAARCQSRGEDEGRVRDLKIDGGGKAPKVPHRFFCLCR